MIALPDVNLLLALTWSNHPHYDLAHQWFGPSAAEGWATCLFTQSAFLRLSLNPQVVGVSIDCHTALGLLEGIAKHPHHQYLATAETLTDSQFDELADRIVGYRQITDATLLHLARSHGMSLVTFDQGIRSVCPWSDNLLVLPTNAN